MNNDLKYIIFFFIITYVAAYSSCQNNDEKKYVDFKNTVWSIPKDNNSFKSLINDKLEIEADNLDEIYIRTSSGSFNSLPNKNESILLNNKLTYSISIEGKKDRRLKVQLWVIMYDENKRIGHKNYYLNMGENVLFESLPNSLYYRIVLKISGDGHALFNKITFKKIEYDNPNSYKSVGLDYNYLVLRNLIKNNFSNRLLKNIFKVSSNNDTTLCLLKSFFPKTEAKKIVDTGITDSILFQKYLKTNNINNIIVRIENKEYEIEKYPPEWSIDPYNDRNWQWYYQFLYWLERDYISNDQVDLNIAGYFISDWFNKEVFKENPLFFTFEDHSLARRFEVINIFINKYIDNNEILDIKILESCMKALIMHIYALASDYYYPNRIPYNHGLFMDLYLFKYIDKYFILKDQKDIEKKAEDRLLLQFQKSYSKSNILIENSPSYHFLVTNSIKEIFDIYSNKEKEPPEIIKDIFNKATFNNIYFLQPNDSFVQFGDTPNKLVGGLINDIKSDEFDYYLDKVNDFDQVLYAFTNGEKGNKPLAEDVVFDDAGYAIFRDNWHNKDTFRDMITGHFTCSNMTLTHYHEDELSFSIYGYGTEIIIDSGMYNYNYEDIYNKYRYSANGHNVLIVDDEKYTDTNCNKMIDNSSIITDYLINNEYSWVQATHNHYERLGVEKLQRTFGLYKPNTFYIIDEIESHHKHKYTQLLNIHPKYTEVNEVEEGIYIISSIEPDLPQLIILLGKKPMNVVISNGLITEQKVEGWYFPEFNQKKECNQLSLEYQSDEETTRLPVLMKIIPPNINYIEIPKELKYNIDKKILHWIDGKEVRKVLFKNK